MSLGFFYDSNGNKSYGRMASFTLCLASIILALLGKDYGALIASAFAFYGASKAQQAYTDGKMAEFQEIPLAAKNAIRNP